MNTSIQKSGKSFKSALLILSLLLVFSSCEKKSDEPVEDAGHGEAGHVEEGGHKESENEIEFTEAQYQTAGIALGAIEEKNLSNVLKVNGVLDVPPQNLVSISAPSGGYLRKTTLIQGARIGKGQALATIENPEFVNLQREYLESYNRLQFLKQEFERQEELSKENVGFLKKLQQASADYKSQQAAIRAMEVQLEQTGINVKSVQSGNITRSITLRSPISGYVTKVNVNIGQFVSPSDVLFEIADINQLQVQLTVFEKDAGKISVGQKVRFTIPGDEVERTATVYLIGRSISTDRTVPIHARLDTRNDNNLIPNMYVKAVIETGSNTVAALPEEAIIKSGEKEYIFIYKGKRKEGNAEMHDFEMTEVTTGASGSGFKEVIVPAEMERSAQVVVKGAFSILAKKENSEGEGHAH